jgi:arginine deiminase
MWKMSDKVWYVTSPDYHQAYVDHSAQYNKLRNYRVQVVKLRDEIQEQKSQALVTKKKHTDWNSELVAKNTAFREEKKAWTSEATALRTAARDINVCRFALWEP